MRSRQPPARCVFLLFVLLVAPACAGGEENVAKPDFETRLALRNAAGKESSAFRGRETITIVVTLRNRGDAPRTLTLPTSQTHDCLVYAGDRKEAWRWSFGRMFAQVITELTLAPGESRAFTSTWGLTDRKGAPLPPGEYQAVGLVPPGSAGLRSDPVAFTILR